MNVNSIKNKKSLKIAILLLSSLLIAGVSASTYYTMLMTGNVSVSGGNKVYFSPGTDWSGTMGDGNQTCTLTLSGGNGTIATYPDPVTINNTDTSPHALNLKLDSWTGDTQAQLNYINITMYNAASGGTKQGNTIYLVPGVGDVTETGSATITVGGTWRVEWIIYWKSTATSETVTVNLKLDVS
ncbi:hypothetical protein MUO79_09650 [Candidatus Bathyarchaeota archaeon]|nr:hypothetical protein [Candidatus Bathyarchaeota archaeon]